jgi:hypothetical protein
MKIKNSIYSIQSASIRWGAALLMVFLVVSLGLTSPAQAGVARQVGDTPTPTATQPPPPAGTFSRPVVVIKSYSTRPSPVNPGQDFDLDIRFYNAGQSTARNIVVNFTPGEALARNTGGVIAIPELFASNHYEFIQPMTMDGSVSGQAVATVAMSISYTDNDGAAYSEAFTLSIGLNVPRYVFASATPTPTITPTPTSAPLERPQLVITRYEPDVSPLQPGTNFRLKLDIQNLGNADARRVTMIVGGSGSLNASGTPEAGIPGASGEFSNFAPLGSSNIQSLGEIRAGGTLSAEQNLIVNVTTAPGAYPMKISFLYLTETGSTVSDEQVITLLVYSLPVVEINFYRDPGPLFVGQPNLLPIQITNLGRKTSVLGNLRVSAPNGILENNVILVGNLEAGGFFTLDATYIPDIPGPATLEVRVDYSDDFNQPRQVTQMISVEVQEMFIPEEPTEGGGGGEFMPPILEEETVWQKIWRFVLGLLGLDSTRQSTGSELMPTEGEMPPIEVQPGGGGGAPLKGP